jgi:hypothetical protein
MTTYPWIKPRVVGCYDCLLYYGDPGWVEAYVPDDVWLRIRPDDSPETWMGILCISCMARRCRELDIENVSMTIVGGPFTSFTWMAGRIVAA